MCPLIMWTKVDKLKQYVIEFEIERLNSSSTTTISYCMQSKNYYGNSYVASS